MRLPDRPGERGALDERNGTGQIRGAGDVLRQRLDRLAACHPSAPDYAQMSPDRELAESGDHGELGSDAAGAGAERAAGEQAADERAAGEQVRQAARAGGLAGELAGRDGELAGREGQLAGRDGELAGREAGQDGELADRDGRRANRPGAGRPAGGQAPDAWRWPDGGATGDLGGGREPYRPWFTAGESPEPWFSSESGG